MDKMIGKIGYKIVRRGFGSSEFTPLSYGYSKIIFELNKKTYHLRGWGPFTIFGCIQDCIDYINENPERDVAIIKCLYNSSVSKMLWADNDRTDILGMWRCNSSVFAKIILRTRFAVWIKPIEIMIESISKGDKISWEDENG